MERYTEQTLQKVFAAIPSGKENAIHQTELARRLNMSPQRVKKCIHELRKQHGNILSSAVGYWVSNDKAELEIYARMQRSQGIARLATIKSTMQSIKECEGQLSFTDL